MFTLFCLFYTLARAEGEPAVVAQENIFVVMPVLEAAEWIFISKCLLNKPEMVGSCIVMRMK